MTDDEKPTPTPPSKGGTSIGRSSPARGGAEGGGVNIDDILHKSQCQFVYDLPNGLDTEIGERGVRLS